MNRLWIESELMQTIALRVGIAIVAIAFLCSCTNSSIRRYGIVSDVSGEPIEGARVTFSVSIMVPRPIDATSVELWSAEQISDSTGRYSLPWWVRVEPVGADGKQFVVSSDDVDVRVDKTGYEYVLQDFGWKSGRVIDIKLRRRKGWAHEDSAPTPSIVTAPETVILYK